MDLQYSTESGLPLPEGSSFADLARALGVEACDLSRRIYARYGFAFEPKITVGRWCAENALAVFDLAPVPAQDALEKAADQLRPSTNDDRVLAALPLGFVAMLLGVSSTYVAKRLERLPTGVPSDNAYGPTDPRRILYEPEIEALARDASPVVDLGKVLREYALHPEVAYARLAEAITAVREQHESGALPRLEAEVPSFAEVAAAEYEEEGDPKPFETLSPRELVLLVASGKAPPYLLDPYATDPVWADIVEYACERHGLKVCGQLTPPDPSRYHDRRYPEENRWKWVVRALRDHPEDPHAILPYLWLDPFIAEWLLRIGHAEGVRALTCYANKFDPHLRKQLIDRTLPLILAAPRDTDAHAAEAITNDRGVEVGLRFVELSLETKVDGPASGAAYAWAGQNDELFRALREYPREKVRAALTCLVPAGDGGTCLDPRITGAARRRFGEQIVPVLLLDRSREVRRRARIAGVLANLPPIVVDFWNPPLRTLREMASEWDEAGRPNDWEPEMPEPSEEGSSLSSRLWHASLDGTLTRALVDEAVGVVLDAERPAIDRDAVSAKLFAEPRAIRELLPHIAAHAIRAGDAELALMIIEAADPGARLLCSLLEAFPDEAALHGAVLASSIARKDPAVQQTLRRTRNPHVLYALARARLGVAFTREAFAALLAVDVDRALRVIEEAPRGTTVSVSDADWSRILEHPSRDMRIRALAIMGGGAALRLDRG